jgi:hypothetical protein
MNVSKHMWSYCPLCLGDEGRLSKVSSLFPALEMCPFLHRLFLNSPYAQLFPAFRDGQFMYQVCWREDVVALAHCSVICVLGILNRGRVYFYISFPSLTRNHRADQRNTFHPSLTRNYRADQRNTFHHTRDTSNPVFTFVVILRVLCSQ